MEAEKVLAAFKAQALFRMEESSRMIHKAVGLLSETDIWKSPNAHSNSVGNQLLHLCGNIRQYAVSGLSGAQDTRDRDREFSAHQSHKKENLLNRFDATLLDAKNEITAMNLVSAMQRRSVQGFEFSGMGIVLHVVEHLSYHTGQIAFLTKWLKDTDLGFYDGMDLNLKNG